MDYSNLSQLLLSTPGNTIREFNDRISHIEGLLFFNIGEPDFPTPQIIKDAAIESIQKNQSFYSHSRGILELRQAIADYVQRKFAVDYDPDTEILVTVGSTEALQLAVQVVTNPGDKILVVDPNYVIYNSQIALAQGEMVPIEVAETGFKLTPQAVRDTVKAIGGAKAIIFNYPTNPTGVTYTEEELIALSDVFRECDLYVISDEVYSEFVFDETHVSIARFIPERTLLINGASKGFAMTGWRSGFLAAPEPIISACYGLHQAMVVAAPTQIQYASAVAYRESDSIVDEMRESYNERRHLLMDGLDQLGIQYVKPKGAFYIFFRIPDWYDKNDVEFCVQLANEKKVALTPASVFGTGGERYVRISYASSLDNLKILLERLGEFIQTHQ